MIAKMSKGTGFKGLLSYLTQATKTSCVPRGNVIVSNMTGNTPSTLAREFGQLRRLRTGLNKAVSHVSISLSPKDRKVSDAELSDVAQHFLKEMGYQECPFVVVRHCDTQHQHIHIVASRITWKGEVVSDAHDYRRAEVVMRHLERAYGFHSPEEKSENKQYLNQNKGEKTMKNELRKQLDDVLNKGVNTQQFITECRKRGIDLVPHIQGKKMNGFAYRYKGQRVRGSELGKRYSWQSLSLTLGYKGDVDFALLETVATAEEDNTCSVTSLEIGNKKRRARARQLFDDDYEAQLRAVYGERILTITRMPGVFIITLNNGVKITDHGNRVTGDSKNSTLLATELLALAVKKGWDEIQLSGSQEFVELAMTEALRNGLEVIPKNDEQITLLEKVKRIVNASAYIVPAEVMVEANKPKNVNARIGQLRARFGIGQSSPVEPKEPTPTPSFGKAKNGGGI